MDDKNLTTEAQMVRDALDSTLLVMVLSEKLCLSEIDVLLAVDELLRGGGRRQHTRERRPPLEGA